MLASSPSARFRLLLVMLAAGTLSACVVLRPPGYGDFKAALKTGEALRIYDTLEALIDNDHDTRTDRKIAWQALRDRNEDTAGFQFAWAAVGGRFVQYKGLLAVNLLKDIERHARLSVTLDPHFRNGAALRLLGTLYVVAPSTFVEHGDSELGLEMLEELVRDHPADYENHLRVAEAYITLNDPAPAAEHLCVCLAVMDQMRKDDQKLLVNLFADAGAVDCPGSTPIPVKKTHKR